MYCSSCGVAIAQGLTYCNYCGEKLRGAKDGSVAKSSELKPETLVSTIAALFIFGLGAMAVLLGVLKQVVGFESHILLAVTVFCSLLLLLVEGVLIRLLLKGKSDTKEAAVGAERMSERTTREIGEAQPRALSEPAASVTEDTTRAFDPIYRERK
jgi:hypothetical protein